MAALGIIARLVVSYPENLGGSKASQSRIGSNLDESLCSYLLGDFLAFLASTLVAPDNGRTDYLICLVQHYQAVHLAGKSDTLDVFLVHAGFCNNLLYGILHCIGPIRWLLLSPAILWLVQWIFLGCRCHHLALLIKKHCLGSRCTNVDTD